MKEISIIIPVYNEIGFIKKVVKKVSKLKLDKEIIFIDDCSTDGTLKKLRSMRSKSKFRLVIHKKNKGKGKAVRSGVKRAKGLYSIIYDADLEYFPKDICFLMKEMKEIREGWPGPEEISIYGSRFMEKYPAKFTLHYIANRFLTFLTNLFFSSHLTDMETCLKLCPTEILRNCRLYSKRFEIEPEITAKLIKRGVLIIERPIRYVRRHSNQGKKIRFRDGLIAIQTIIKERFMAD